jgi:hypothetical protein
MKAIEAKASCWRSLASLLLDAPPLATASMANTDYYFIKSNMGVTAASVSLQRLVRSTGEAVGSVGAAVLEWAWKAERRGQ